MNERRREKDTAGMKPTLMHTSNAPNLHELAKAPVV